MQADFKLVIIQKSQSRGELSNKQKGRQLLPLDPTGGDERDCEIQVVCQHMGQVLPVTLPTTARTHHTVQLAALSFTSQRWAATHLLLPAQHQPSQAVSRGQFIAAGVPIEGKDLHQFPNIAVLPVSHLRRGARNVIKTTFHVVFLNAFMLGNTSWALN